MKKEEELRFMLDFAKTLGPHSREEFEQLISLFTAYCLHYDIELDTNEADKTARKVFEALPDRTVAMLPCCLEESTESGAFEQIYLQLGKNLC